MTTGGGACFQWGDDGWPIESCVFIVCSVYVLMLMLMLVMMMFDVDI